MSFKVRKGVTMQRNKKSINLRKVQHNNKNQIAISIRCSK